jgi:hypothetical protein
MYQHLPLHDPPIFTQVCIFGLKIYNLATLMHLSIPHSKYFMYKFYIKYHKYKKIYCCLDQVSMYIYCNLDQV